jgi:predicted ATPase
VTALTMSRLDRRQGADPVTRVTGEKPLPAEIVEQIAARTDGVPLFVEELTKTVLESGLLVDAGDITTSCPAGCRRSRSRRPCTTR